MKYTEISNVLMLILDQLHLKSNLTLSIKLFSCLVSAIFSTWVFVFIPNCGDVHPNPGPGSDNDLADVSQSNSNDSFGMLSNHLSIFHLNVQSFLPKFGLLRGEAEAYDILVISETWLKPVIENDTTLIENLCHLSGKTGVTVLAKVLPYMFEKL